MNNIIKLAIIGLGRIGKVHLKNAVALEGCQVSGVFDPQQALCQQLAQQYHTKAFASLAALFADADTDAVLVASPAEFHVSCIQQAAAAGKHVLCEKPIDLSMKKVLECEKLLQAHPVTVQIGFQRRFDPHHQAVRQAIEDGQIGKIYQTISTSRDLDIPPEAYLAESGGLFRDMMIHDFDVIRYLTNETPSRVYAVGSQLSDPPLFERTRDLGEAATILTYPSGITSIINCARRSGFGYDQRVEVLGEKGMVRMNNVTKNTMDTFTENSSHSQSALEDFFIQRYEKAYLSELAAFIQALAHHQPSPCPFENGRFALAMADAATESFHSQQAVDIHYPSP